MCETMKNVKEFTFAPGFPYMVNSCDKHIHTLPDSSAEVDNILHIYIYIYEIMLKSCHYFSLRMGL